MFLIITFLLDKINVDFITLCGSHFQSIGLTLISYNKRVNAKENIEKRMLLTIPILPLRPFFPNSSS